MSVYIVTENNYFFLGIESKLSIMDFSAKKINAKELEESSKSDFSEEDTFVFYTSNYSVELSFLISIGHYPGRIVFIPTDRKSRFNSAFRKHVFLDYNTKINTILDQIVNKKENDIISDSFFENKLTKREEMILRHTINGMNAESIGQYLAISTKTVYAHRRNALHKLGGRNLFEIWPVKERTLRAASL